MTKSRFFRGLGHFPVDKTLLHPNPLPPWPPSHAWACGVERGALGFPRGWGLLTGVVSNVSINGQAPDVVGLDHVGVPFLAVAGVVQHVIERLGWDVLAGDASLWGDGKSDKGSRTHPQSMGLCPSKDEDFRLSQCAVARPLCCYKVTCTCPWGMLCTHGEEHIPASGQPKKSLQPCCRAKAGG